MREVIRPQDAGAKILSGATVMVGGFLTTSHKVVAPGVCVDEVLRLTEAPLIVPAKVPTMALSDTRVHLNAA